MTAYQYLPTLQANKYHAHQMHIEEGYHTVCPKKYWPIVYSNLIYKIGQDSFPLYFSIYLYLIFLYFFLSSLSLILSFCSFFLSFCPPFLSIMYFYFFLFLCTKPNVLSVALSFQLSSDPTNRPPEKKWENILLSLVHFIYYWYYSIPNVHIYYKFINQRLRATESSTVCPRSSYSLYIVT